MENSRQEILRGIETLALVGTPGRVTVFRPGAEPILTGSEAEDVLIAAAELGKGRIVCISHDGYFQKFYEDGQHDFGKLHENLKKWLTRGMLQNNGEIVNTEEDVKQEKLLTAKLATWQGGAQKMSPDKLREFVYNGGGFLSFMTPWGWKQIYGGKPLNEAPYADLIAEAGLSYTDEYINVRNNRFSVNENKAENAHLFRILEDVSSHANKTEKYVETLKRLQFLPSSAIHQLKPELERQWHICNEEIKKNNPPSPKHPAQKKEQVFIELWLLYIDLLDLSKIKAPGVDIFPGDFASPPPMKSRTFEFKTVQEDFHSTSCYLPPGEILKVAVLSGNEGKNWQVLVGCHMDRLNRGSIRRWPKVFREVQLTSDHHTVASAFGGLVYFISPNEANSRIKVKLENVVDSPVFKLADGLKGKAAWATSRQAPGLWADIVGELITITLPAASVRKLEFEEVTSAIKIWDSVIRLYHSLRGTDALQTRRQWIVADEQPSAGYMHAGYPIVTHLDVIDPNNKDLFMLNSEKIRREGRWGEFHMIGHNMQRQEWTFEGTEGVTSNIFTLCAMDNICNLQPWIHSWLRKSLREAEKYLKEGADFEKWKRDAGIALFIYAQLVHEFGWDSYKKVFRKYEAMPDGDKPRDNQQKIDTWFKIFSEVVGYNLSPLAKFWGIGITVDMNEQLREAFPVAFLPDDELTQMTPDRVEAIIKQFPGIVRERLDRVN